MNEDPRSSARSIHGAPNEITQSQLSRLVCPVCHSGLLLEIMEDAAAPPIRCTGCGRGYPVVDGLPVLLADRSISYAADLRTRIKQVDS